MSNEETTALLEKLTEAVALLCRHTADLVDERANHRSPDADRPSMLHAAQQLRAIGLSLRPESRSSGRTQEKAFS